MGSFSSRASASPRNSATSTARSGRQRSAKRTSRSHGVRSPVRSPIPWRPSGHSGPPRYETGSFLEDDMIHLKGETYTLDASGKMQNRNISNVKISAHPNTGQGDWSDYEEAPWLSKHGSLYYLNYAAHFPESINYATSTSPEGPWQFRGTVIDRATKDPSTLHSTIFDFHGAGYMGYHNAALPTGGDYRRSQCIDRVYYNADGTLKKLVRTQK